VPVLDVAAAARVLVPPFFPVALDIFRSSPFSCDLGLSEVKFCRVSVFPGASSMLRRLVFFADSVSFPIPVGNPIKILPYAKCIFPLSGDFVSVLSWVFSTLSNVFLPSAFEGLFPSVVLFFLPM